MNRLIVTLAISSLSAAALAQGMSQDASAGLWTSPLLQARVGINAGQRVNGSGVTWQQQTAVVLGDYYFSRGRLGTSNVSSGFRATSGLLLGQRSLTLGTAVVGGSQGVSLTVLRQPRLAISGSESLQEGWSAVPYFGVGWSGASMRGGWGVTADFGFAGRGSGLHANTSQAVDDLLRELRLTPLLHLGVSYAF